MVENTQKQWTDDRLIAEAESGLRGQGAVVEAMRRLRVTIEQASVKSDIYARRIVMLNVILAVLTLVLAIDVVDRAIVPVIKAWFH
jgi:hypothetical protein